ncbi:hypothetical protein K7I12_13990 [Halomonas sp. IOP_31]|nr:hypothetical protein [Halomonas sp. IOP_31]
MRALTWQGTDKLSVETIPDPQLVNPRMSSSASRCRRSAARICIC